LPFEDHPLCEWPEWLLQEAMHPRTRGNPDTNSRIHHGQGQCRLTSRSCWKD
jgi:hypothetical protein